MDYRSLITRKYCESFSDPRNKLNFFNPIESRLLKELEMWLGKTLPKDLREFYLQSDGAHDDWFCFNILSTSKLFEHNKSLREGAFEFNTNLNEALVFSLADGDYYFYQSIKEGWGEIYIWNAIDDDRSWVANTLEAWIVRS